MYLEVIAPVAVCLMAAAAAAFTAALGYKKRAARIKNEFRVIVNGCADMSGCEYENLAKIEELAASAGGTRLKRAVAHLSAAAEKTYRGAAVPDPAEYMEYGELCFAPSRERELSVARAVFAASAALMLLLPSVIAALSGSGAPLAVCAGWSGAGLCAMAVIAAACRTLTLKAASAMQEGLAGLVAALRAALPAASSSAEGALFLESSRQNTESFRAAAEELCRRLDRFETGEVLPTLSASFEGAVEKNLAPPINSMTKTLRELSSALIRKQDEEITALSEAFAARLGDTVERRINRLAGSVGSVNDRLNELGETLRAALSASGDRLTAVSAAIEKASALNSETAVIQKLGAESFAAMSGEMERVGELVKDIETRDADVFARMDGLGARLEAQQAELKLQLDLLSDAGTKTVEAVRAASETLSGELADTVGRFENAVKAFSDDTDARFSEAAGNIAGATERFSAVSERRYSDAARTLSEAIASFADAGRKQYSDAAEQSSRMLEEVVQSLKETVDGLGASLAEGVRASSEENAALVDKLAQRTAELRDTYESYFTAAQSRSADNLSDMEFRIQAVFTRFSESAGEIMSKLEGNVNTAMAGFSGSTSTLLESIEEQSRSIGLYAKELNLDVSSLSTSLRESVETFEQKAHESTERTFADFDAGLAEIAARLANTVETINDAVDGLSAKK